MKAEIKGIKVEGTPHEIAKLYELLVENRPPKYGPPTEYPKENISMPIRGWDISVQNPEPVPFKSLSPQVGDKLKDHYINGNVKLKGEVQSFDE